MSAIVNGSKNFLITFSQLPKENLTSLGSLFFKDKSFNQPYLSTKKNRFFSSGSIFIKISMRIPLPLGRGGSIAPF
ncbi:hypothetical protein [Candidatus Neptunochlamydia vexilliferae]|uniref:Uncharacterized protein n=1 Tax=Candidatus Neptunichlamydia vexilliferae TaxID=1651774 RepID=A0ABS0B253_9BACT|nr:hypothetical protein [Candidatus Neptunochlamydia vexilliferae]MBF5060279.1 hypothetical protein [Candidatus Neptunochlamydia vexilliferae]